MVKAIQKLELAPDQIHHKDVRSFNWDERPKRYQCVFGVWCLGYLKKKHCMAMLCGIKRVVQPKGFIILFEAILKQYEIVERLGGEIETQEVVRFN